jgi:chaperonin GroES
MTLKPLLDKVVLKKVEAVEVTKAGILLPGAAQEKPQVSVIEAVGPGGIVDGKEVVMTLKVGDQVICGKYAGTEVKLDGKEYVIVSQSDVLVVIED